MNKDSIKKAESLPSSEINRLLEIVVESTKDYVFVVDRKMLIRYVNRFSADRAGCDRASVVGKSISDIAPPSVASTFISHADKTFKTGNRIAFEDHVVIQGESTWLSTLAIPIKDDKGRVTMVLCMARDISGKKEAEEGQERTSRAYQEMFEMYGAAMAIVDENMVISYVNKRFEELGGFAKDEVENKKNLTDFIVKEDAQILINVRHSRHESPNAAPETYQLRCRDKYGRIRNTVANIDVIPESGKLIISLVDVTEKASIERALMDSEERFRYIIQQMPYPVAVTDAKGNASIVNKAFIDQFGVLSVGKLKSDFNLLADPVMRANSAISEIERAYKGEIVCIQELRVPLMEYKHRYGGTSKTDEVIKSVTMFPILNKAGKVWQVVAIWTDLAECEKAHAKAKRWEYVIDNARWGVGVVEEGSNTLSFMNKAFAAMHGFTVEELTGKPIERVYSVSQRKRLPELIRKTKKQGRISYKTKHIRKDGTVFPVFIDATLVKDDLTGKEFFVAYVQDMTDITIEKSTRNLKK